MYRKSKSNIIARNINKFPDDYDCIVNKTRSSLESNTVNTLVCLHSWLKDDTDI